MGREQTRARKLLYFCTAGLILLSLSNCATSKKEFTTTSGQEVFPAKVSGQGERVKPACESILRAKRLFNSGDYAGALKENQRVLSLSGRNSPGDQALFSMGLIYAHVENPQRDFGKALLLFRRIPKDYPRSPLVEEAMIWAGVLQENEKLSQMIEKFKQVDIAVEEKKREKGR
jgi:hypothetical protein